MSEGKTNKELESLVRGYLSSCGIDTTPVSEKVHESIARQYEAYKRRKAKVEANTDRQ